MMGATDLDKDELPGDAPDVLELAEGTPVEVALAEEPIAEAEVPPAVGFGGEC